MDCPGLGCRHGGRQLVRTHSPAKFRFRGPKPGTHRTSLDHDFDWRCRKHLGSRQPAELVGRLNEQNELVPGARAAQGLGRYEPREFLDVFFEHHAVELGRARFFDDAVNDTFGQLLGESTFY